MHFIVLKNSLLRVIVYFKKCFFHITVCIMMMGLCLDTIYANNIQYIKMTLQTDHIS